MSSLSTHVLDAVRGIPGPGIAVTVTGPDESVFSHGVTDDDGRIGGLAPDGIPAGIYRISFATGEYFESIGTAAFYPRVDITFVVEDDRHYHVPVLLSPFAFSTYRGS